MREVPSCLSCVAFTVLKLLGLLQSPKKGKSSVLDAAFAQPVSLLLIICIIILKPKLLCWHTFFHYIYIYILIKAILPTISCAI